MDTIGTNESATLAEVATFRDYSGAKMDPKWNDQAWQQLLVIAARWAE